MAVNFVGRPWIDANGSGTFYPLAFSGWMNTTTTTSNTSLGGQCDASSSNDGWNILLNNTANKLSLYGKATGSNALLFAHPTTVNDGNWHHVAVSLDFSNGGTNKLWVDGVVATGTASQAWGPIRVSLNNNPKFGKSADSFWAIYPGSFAELALFNSQLTDAEVASMQLGFSPLAVTPRKLARYWPLLRLPTGALGEYLGPMDNVSKFENSNGTHTLVTHPRVIY